MLHYESVSPHVTACLCFLLQHPDAGGDFWVWRQHEAGRTRSRFSSWVTRTSRLQSADCDNSSIFTNVKAENDDSLYHKVNIIYWTNLTPDSIFHLAKILIKDLVKQNKYQTWDDCVKHQSKKIPEGNLLKVARSETKTCPQKLKMFHFKNRKMDKCYTRAARNSLTII